MDRTKLHVIKDIEDALAWYRMYQRMSVGKSDIYLSGLMSKVIKKMHMLEAEYKALGGSKYAAEYREIQSALETVDGD